MVQLRTDTPLVTSQSDQNQAENHRNIENYHFRHINFEKKLIFGILSEYGDHPPRFSDDHSKKLENPGLTCLVTSATVLLRSGFLPVQIRYETLQVGSFDFLRSIHIVRMVPEALTQKFFDLRSGDNKMCLGSSKIHEYKRFGKEIISEMVQKAKS